MGTTEYVWMTLAGKATATDEVTLSGVRTGLGLQADITLENLIQLSAEGARRLIAKSLRQKDKVLLF